MRKFTKCLFFLFWIWTFCVWQVLAETTNSFIGIWDWKKLRMMLWSNVCLCLHMENIDFMGLACASGRLIASFFFFFFACWYHAMSIQFYYYYSSSSTFRYTCDCTFGVWLLVRLWRASTITHLIFMRCIEWPTCGDMYLQSLYACTHTAYDRNRFIQQIIQNQI